MDTPLEGQRIARQESIRAQALTARSGGVQRPRTKRAGEGEYLAFGLGQDEYGFDILRVREIRAYEQPTRIAYSPAVIKGVVNLRGAIVPIVDLRLKLGCAKVEYDGFTAVIVLDVNGRLVGAVVDSVSDVIALGKDHIEPGPEWGSAFDPGHIAGIGTVASGDTRRTLILLDVVALMAGAEMGLLVA